MSTSQWRIRRQFFVKLLLIGVPITILLVGTPFAYHPIRGCQTVSGVPGFNQTENNRFCTVASAASEVRSRASVKRAD